VGWLVERPWGEWLLNHWPRVLWPWFWQYLFSDLSGLPFADKWNRIVCRWRGHPRGEVYWNPGGDEPNHDCKDCGEDLG
jgi:hypothetical protein